MSYCYSCKIVFDWNQDRASHPMCHVFIKNYGEDGSQDPRGRHGL